MANFRVLHKLSFRFYGPFQIIQKVGPVAYKLALPDTSKIHPVVHVSQLKKHIAPSSSVSIDLSAVCTDPLEALQPESFLGTRYTNKGSSTVKQVLVQWSSLPADMATWEEVFDLRRRYPEAPAWGQAGFQGEGIVRRRARSTSG